ncbi:unnamed protein product, partial [Choristocarpus tenellus]
CTHPDFGPVLKGTDVVAYFDLDPGQEQVPGSPSHSSSLGDYVFWFSTAANKIAFERDPWKYAPQYGSFCSWGISNENWWSADFLGPFADPGSWMVADDKLYLF